MRVVKPRRGQDDVGTTLMDLATLHTVALAQCLSDLVSVVPAVVGEGCASLCFLHHVFEHSLDRFKMKQPIWPRPLLCQVHYPGWLSQKVWDIFQCNFSSKYLILPDGCEFFMRVEFAIQPLLIDKVRSVFFLCEQCLLTRGNRNINRQRKSLAQHINTSSFFFHLTGLRSGIYERLPLLLT